MFFTTVIQYLFSVNKASAFAITLIFIIPIHFINNIDFVKYFSMIGLALCLSAIVCV